MTISARKALFCGALTRSCRPNFGWIFSEVPFDMPSCLDNRRFSYEIVMNVTSQLGWKSGVRYTSPKLYLFSTGSKPNDVVASLKKLKESSSMLDEVVHYAFDHYGKADESQPTDGQHTPPDIGRRQKRVRVGGASSFSQGAPRATPKQVGDGAHHHCSEARKS